MIYSLALLLQGLDVYGIKSFSISANSMRSPTTTDLLEEPVNL